MELAITPTPVAIKTCCAHHTLPTRELAETTNLTQELQTNKMKHSIATKPLAQKTSALSLYRLGRFDLFAENCTIKVLQNCRQCGRKGKGVVFTTTLIE